ncbi:AAA-domain-containing protein [Serendipita vermifera]|nr:AAA-domain-containing protein [Serendipita vermifera]
MNSNRHQPTNRVTERTEVVFFDEAEDGDAEYIKVGNKLWTQLGLEGGEEPKAIALTPIKPLNGISRSLICWAKPDPEVDHAAVPRIWTQQHSNILLQDPVKRDSLTCDVTVATPLPLDEVILSAQSYSAYHLANSDREYLIKKLSEGRKIIREGDIIEIPPLSSLSNGHGGDFLHKYNIIMTDPIHQGFVEAESTRIIVVNEDSDDEETNQSPASQNGTQSIDDNEEEEESEIDESFLLNSLIQPDMKRSDEDLLVEVGLSLTALPMRTSHLLPQDQYRDLTILIRTAELARLSLFSGDWVTIFNPEERASARIARIIGCDLSNSLPPQSGCILVPPTLLYNLGLNPNNPSKIRLRQGSSTQQEPPLPIAKSVTLARIASHISVHRKYQPIVFQALRRHFQQAKQVLKKGDVISLPINISEAPLLDSLSEADPKQGISAEQMVDQLQLDHQSFDHVVFFRVTHVEHNLIQMKTHETPDNHFAALMGELGCWVDPDVSRMVQGGLENSKVPNLDEYFALNKNGAPLTTECRGSLLCGPETPFSQLRDVFLASLQPMAQGINLSVTVLLTGGRGIGKRTATHWAACDLGLHPYEIDCFDLADEANVKMEGSLRARFEQAEEIAPSILVLRNIDALARANQRLESGKEPAIALILQECISNLHAAWARTGFPIIVVATVHDVDAIPLSVRACFKHQIAFQVPNEDERLAILTNMLRASSLGADVSLENVATQTAALVAEDLKNLVDRTHVAAAKRIASICEKRSFSIEDLAIAGYSLTAADFESALSQTRAAFSASIGAPSIPKVSWDDVGGLASVKADILDTIQLPLQNPELFAGGMKKRSGILLFGPPGTGKTLLAKAVATSFSLNFFSVKGPELLNMYIGESEANVRRVFQRARDARPCVIFFDELDSVAPKRGNHGDSGGVMDRIVSQLLAELDGMSDGSGADVFVIGATNRPDLLDPALLRPGRFDKLLYLGVSETHDAQLKIIEALTRKFRLDPQLDLREIAEQCPFNYTGADFYALCSDAMLKAMTRRASMVDEKIAVLNSQPPLPSHIYPITPQYYLAEMAMDEDTDITVTREDFVSALKELVPSVSQTEMEHYRQVQKRFSEEVHKDTDEEVEEGAGAAYTLNWEEPEPRPKDIKGKGRAV